MSGLIFAGIGKGIADAGQTFAQAGMRQYEMDRQDEREALREERLLKRQEALDELKAERERAREEQLQQRVIKESAAVGTKANEIGTAREGRAFDRLAESSAMAGEQGDVALSKEQLQRLSKENPELGEQYKKLGLIESSMPLTVNQRRMQRADDEVQASMDIGAHSSVQKSLMDKRKSVLDEIKEENRDARDQRRDALAVEREARRDAEFKAMMPVRQQQANAATTNAGANVTRANRPPSSGGGAGGSGAPKVRSTYTNNEGNKVAVMSDGSEKTLGKAGDFDKSVANLVNTMSKNDFQFNKLSEAEKRQKAIERLTGGATAPNTSDNRSSTSGTTTKNYSNLWK
jgi:hypothetical protein